MDSGKAKKNEKVQSILDAFSELAAEDEKKRIDSTLDLMKHLAESNAADEESKEITHACRRLIRGLGSGRESARKGYYVAFVAFLHNFPTFPLQNIFDIVNKELEMGKFGSKGEEGEVCCGRMLAFGALIRAGYFTKSETEDQKYIITEMVEASNHKSYLPQVLPTFVLQLLEPRNKQLFKDVLWPALSPLILKPWSEQTLDSIYLMLKVAEAFPHILKKSEVKKLTGGSSVVTMETLNDICSVLFNIKGTWYRHPVYEEVCKELGRCPNVAVEFWQSNVDSQLLGPKTSRSKGSLAIEIFCSLVSQLKSSIPQFLTTRFIALLRQRLIRLIHADDGSEEMRLEATTALETLVVALKSAQTSDSVRVQCLEKIVTAARGDFGFDQVTKSNIIHSIVMALKFEGLACVASLCHAVITGDSHPCKGDDEESNDSLPTTWLNKDRIAAIHLLATLATHSAATSDFQTEQTLVLVEHAFFPPPGCTSLCPAAKEGLLRCIALTSPAGDRTDPLSTMRGQLTHVITFINNKVTKGQKPHKTSKEVVDAWKRMMVAVGQLKDILSADKKSKASSQKNLANVLLVLFMQLGVQLLIDSELAIDSLQELHLCVEKAGLTKVKKSSKSQKDEPHWIEVVTDLFLSLLSQSSSMLRNIVNRVFSAMCPLMTESALLSLVQVVDCSSENNPLSVRSEAQQPIEEGSESEPEEEQEEELSNESEQDEESPDEDLEDEAEDTVSDRVRAAVRSALGEAAELTDTESVDVDDISEEEGQKLDEALSQAFSALRKGGSKGSLTKKQARDIKDLVHFRVRVMDLIDTYIQSEQSLYLVCTLIPLLFHALEACLKDVTQKPLESRLRNCLRKISNVKKFATLENVSNEVLTSLLQSMIEKGDRTAAVFLDVSHEVCVVSSFIVRSSQLLPDSQLHDEITNIFVKALNNFFNKRDCLLPPSFFSLVLKTTWIGNFELWPYLVTAAFDNPSVRPFRRSQALTLLREFVSNEKLLSSNEKEKTKLGSSLNANAGQLLMSLVGSSSGSSSAIKSRFLKELFQLLIVVHQHCKSTNWSELKSSLTLYLKSVQSQQISKEIKKIMKKLQNKLGVTETTIESSEVTEFQFVKPRPLVNGTGKGKKRKHDNDDEEVPIKSNKHMSNEKNMKRKAKELRLNTLSDGLDVSMSFSAVNLDQVSLDS